MSSSWSGDRIAGPTGADSPRIAFGGARVAKEEAETVSGYAVRRRVSLGRAGVAESSVSADGYLNWRQEAETKT